MPELNGVLLACKGAKIDKLTWDMEESSPATANVQGDSFIRICPLTKYVDPGPHSTVVTCEQCCGAGAGKVPVPFGRSWCVGPAPAPY